VEREAATDKRPFDHRLKILGGTVAALDARRSAKLILELMELPGRWDGWTRVGALENLLLSGVSLRLDEVLKFSSRLSKIFDRMVFSTTTKPAGCLRGTFA
jgi:hypothetical protein